MLLPVFLSFINYNKNNVCQLLATVIIIKAIIYEQKLETPLKYKLEDLPVFLPSSHQFLLLINQQIDCTNITITRYVPCFLILYQFSHQSSSIASIIHIETVCSQGNHWRTKWWLEKWISIMDPVANNGFSESFYMSVNLDWRIDFDWNTMSTRLESMIVKNLSNPSCKWAQPYDSHPSWTLFNTTFLFYIINLFFLFL